MHASCVAVVRPAAARAQDKKRHGNWHEPAQQARFVRPVYLGGHRVKIAELCKSTIIRGGDKLALPGGKGLPYFPLDTELDDKFELIEAEFGLTGFAVIIKLFQRIYAKGFYCEWTEEVALLFAKRIGVGGNVVSPGISSGVPSLSIKGGGGVLEKKEVAPLFASAGGGVVSEIVVASIKRGIFDEEMFNKYSILTSKGIQERYFDATKRRKHFEIDGAYLLVSGDKIPNNVYINAENVDRKRKNVNRNEQRRGEESKGEENNLSCPESPDGEPEREKGGKGKKTFAHDSIPYKAAKYIADKMREHSPNDLSIRPDNLEKSLQSWADEMDKAIRIDKRNVDELRQVLQFSQTDNFWKMNVKSGAKFRKQYDMMRGKMEMCDD